MDMTLPEDATTADTLKLMSLKKEVMASVLSAGVRVNDGALRKKDEDKVAQLLERVKGKTAPRPEPEIPQEPTIDELFA